MITLVMYFLQRLQQQFGLVVAHWKCTYLTSCHLLHGSPPPQPAIHAIHL